MASESDQLVYREGSARRTMVANCEDREEGLPSGRHLPTCTVPALLVLTIFCAGTAVSLSLVEDGKSTARNATVPPAFIEPRPGRHLKHVPTVTPPPGTRPLIPSGPSRTWRPRRESCVHKVSCRRAEGIGQKLGNCLLDLSGVLVQAVKQNLCFAWVPAADIKYLRQILDFPSDEVIDVAEPTGVDRLSVQMSHLQDCVYDDFDPYDIANSTQLLQDYFVSTGRLLCNGTDRPELGPEGVVLHMRSGDIMTPETKAGVGPQPPCNFYTWVVEHGNNGTAFDKVLIVTEPDMRNPCVGALRQWFPSKVKVQAHGINEDACVMVTASNLALSGWSAWGMGLTRLNVHLKNLHIPMGEDSKPSEFLHTNYYVAPDWPQHWIKQIVREDGMPYAQHVYSFPNFSTYWSNWNERTASMLSYPKELIIKRSILPLHVPENVSSSPHGLRLKHSGDSGATSPAFSFLSVPSKKEEDSPQVDQG